jgi:hypothetical protein
VENIYELLDIIDEQTNQSELAVMEAMILSFDKASTIMEAYDGDDIGCFGMIMESANDESAVKKILLFIPRLIASLFKSLRDAMSKKNKAVNITAPKPLPVKKDSDLGKKLAIAGAGAAVVCAGASVAIIGPKDLKEMVDETVDTVKDKIHKKDDELTFGSDSDKFDLEKIRNKYNERMKKAVDDKRKMLSNIKVGITDEGKWFVDSVPFTGKPMEFKEEFYKFFAICEGNNKFVTDKDAHHKKYSYESFVRDSATSPLRHTDIVNIPWWLCNGALFKENLDEWINAVNESLKYATSKEFENKVTKSLEKLFSDLELAGKTSFSHENSPIDQYSGSKAVITSSFIDDIVKGKYSLADVKQMINLFEKEHGSDFFVKYEVDKKDKPWDMAYLKELELKSVGGLCSKQFILHLAEVSEYVHKNQKKKSSAFKDLTTHYSKNILTKYATEIPKFVFQIINDYVDILSQIRSEVDRQVLILEKSINKNNGSSSNESKKPESESK